MIAKAETLSDKTIVEGYYTHYKLRDKTILMKFKYVDGI